MTSRGRDEAPIVFRRLSTGIYCLRSAGDCESSPRVSGESLRPGTPPGNPFDPGLRNGPTLWPPFGRGARGRCRDVGLRAPRPKLGQRVGPSPRPSLLPLRPRFLADGSWCCGPKSGLWCLVERRLEAILPANPRSVLPPDAKNRSPERTTAVEGGRRAWVEDVPRLGRALGEAPAVRRPCLYHERLAQREAQRGDVLHPGPAGGIPGGPQRGGRPPPPYVSCCSSA